MAFNAAASETEDLPGDVDVAGAVPGLGQGGLGLPTMSSASLMRGIDPGHTVTRPPLRPRFFKNGPEVLYELHNIDSHTHIAIGYIHPAMLEAYLFQVDHMLHNPEQHVEVGYTCSFSYNRGVSPGDKPTKQQSLDTQWFAIVPLSIASVSVTASSLSSNQEISTSMRSRACG